MDEITVEYCCFDEIGTEYMDKASFMLKCLLDLECCCKASYASKWTFRIITGFVVSEIEFIIVCRFNSDVYLDDNIRKGLFGFLTAYIPVVYLSLSCWTICNNRQTTVTVNKILDIISDALLVTYNYILTDDVSGTFATICVVLAAINMLMALLTLITIAGSEAQYGGHFDQSHEDNVLLTDAENDSYHQLQKCTNKKSTSV
ncbi:unnamed protein product [Mytilus coruscus]|uniref:Uncharacterized protein n=1 Tax=Mytilus coruscus TaxID=42192 RepID=A0A6J8DCU6_MYTCO|nr:unnamed protein product [Mytilus coruscus]